MHLALNKDKDHEKNDMGDEYKWSMTMMIGISWVEKSHIFRKFQHLQTHWNFLAIILWQQWWHLWWWYKYEWASLSFKINLFYTKQIQPREGGSSYGPSPPPHITLNMLTNIQYMQYKIIKCNGIYSNIHAYRKLEKKLINVNEIMCLQMIILV